MNESSLAIYTLEEYYYDHATMTLKSLINTIYELEGLKCFYSNIFWFLDRYDGMKSECSLTDIYEYMIEEFKSSDRVDVMFVCNHKRIELKLELVDRCLLNPINSTIYIKKFKEEIINE